MTSSSTYFSLTNTNRTIILRHFFQIPTERGISFALYLARNYFIHNYFTRHLFFSLSFIVNYSTNDKTTKNRPFERACLSIPLFPVPLFSVVESIKLERPQETMRTFMKARSRHRDLSNRSNAPSVDTRSPRSLSPRDRVASPFPSSRSAERESPHRRGGKWWSRSFRYYERQANPAGTLAFHRSNFLFYVTRSITRAFEQASATHANESRPCTLIEHFLEACEACNRA